MHQIPLHVWCFLYVAIGVMRAQAGCRIMSPCGSGKSTLLRLVARVLAKHHIKMVVGVQRRATAEALCDALRQDGVFAVIYLGYDQAECNLLRGFAPKMPGAPFRSPPCHGCVARPGCNYGCRDDAFPLAQVVVGTHDSLLRAMEKTPRRFHQCVIFFDEDPSPYADMAMTYHELAELIEQFDPRHYSQLNPSEPIRVAQEAFRSLQALLTTTCPPDVAAHVGAGLRASIAALMKQIRDGIYSEPFKRRADAAVATTNGDCAWVKRLENLMDITRDRGDDADMVLLNDTASGTVLIRRARFVLRPSISRNSCLYILSATTNVHPTRYPTYLPIQDLSWLALDVPIYFHVAWGAPTKKHVDDHTQVGLDILANIVPPAEGFRPLVLTSKVINEGMGRTDLQVASLLQCVATLTGVAVGDVVHMTRGRITGENEARHCNLVFIASMPLFTQLVDFCLTAAFWTGRDVALSRAIDKGFPKMTKYGKFQDADIETVYTRHLIHEVTQTIMRGCARSGRPMHVVIALRTPADLLALYLSGMKGIHVCPPAPDARATDQERRYDTTAVALLEVLAMPHGTPLRKSTLAMDCGYQDARSARGVVASLFVDTGVLQQDPNNAQLWLRTDRHHRGASGGQLLEDTRNASADESTDHTAEQGPSDVRQTGGAA